MRLARRATSSARPVFCILCNVNVRDGMPQDWSKTATVIRSFSLIKRLFHSRVCAAALLALGIVAFDAGAADVDTAFFESKIRPVLVESCYKCHSAESERVKGGLLLDSREGLLKGGDSGAALVPGDPEKGTLIKALRYKDEALQMPPKEPLAPEVIANFEKWVKA